MNQLVEKYYFQCDAKHGYKNIFHILQYMYITTPPGIPEFVNPLPDKKILTDCYIIILTN